MIKAPTTDGCAALEDLCHARVHGNHQILLILDLDVPLLYHQFDPVAKFLVTEAVDDVADVLARKLHYLYIIHRPIREPQEGPGRVLLQPPEDLLHRKVFIEWYADVLHEVVLEVPIE